MNGHVGVVTGHDHFLALRQLNHTGDVGGAEVELRGVVGEERLVTPALFLIEHVDGGLEVGVRGGGTGLDHDHAALHVLLLRATEQQADVLTGTTLVEDLAEHLDTGDGGGLLLRTDADEVNGVAGPDDTALDTTGDHGATTGDGEDVLDGHQERLVGVTLGLRDVLVNRIHELEDAAGPLLIAVQRRESRHPDDRQVVAVEFLGGENLAKLHLDQVDEVGILVGDHVALVEGHDNGRHTDLTGEQDVLVGLRHRAVGGGHDEDRAVHLGGTGDHVLDVVSVPGAVDVRVVTLLGLVLDVRDRDGDTALTLLRGLVDAVERGQFVQLRVLVVEHLGDRRGQSGLAVVDVSDGADVAVRLGPLKLGFCHVGLLLGPTTHCAWPLFWCTPELWVTPGVRRPKLITRAHTRAMLSGRSWKSNSRPHPSPFQQLSSRKDSSPASSWRS